MNIEWSGTLALALRTKPGRFIRDHADLRRRGSVINRSEELQGREGRKLALMATVMVSALTDRGTPTRTTQLLADLAVIFVQASRYWMNDPTATFASRWPRPRPTHADHSRMPLHCTIDVPEPEPSPAPGSLPALSATRTG